MVKIRKNMVPDHIAKKVTYGGTNTKTYIIIHETDNTNRGANADAHGRLQASGNSRAASWQYTSDDKEIVQSFSDNAQCWAAGNSHYNKHGIHIEICVNEDGDYLQAVKNAIELTITLMKKHNIPLKHVIRHYDASGKNCPRHLMSGSKGINWNQFKSKLTGSTTASKPEPSSPSKPTGKGDMKTTSIVTYLNSIGENSTYVHREKLAKQYGIKGYEGSAAQNTKLLNLLRGGSKPTKPSKPTTKPEAPKNKQRGVATVTVPSLSLRMAPNVKGKLIRTLKKGESYKVWDEQGGWLRLGKDMWASWQNGAYMDWTEKPIKNQSKPSKPAESRTFKVGQKVKIKSSATKYATGQRIPSQYKNKTYTIQQLKSDRVLIKELVSWVFMKDIV